ncbi:hypothetical protein BU14_0125s0011 [Porphyra umbilicalis]|uniref:Protein xylosyltransferase n=1 Tax=Porphyra umbilicalis TaxID=2786 RepID=A0A1X6PBI7_PORUM|nr:hypothetical protein BU14_0125s0011 [Porphyra umbilicalis]|eukprot:OSX78023.1 hypothetical protein BU14_0125s0011 [Porphyra umbilicalis]
MAIFIQVSGANLPLFPRLLARVHHPRNTYAVHFDAAIPDAALTPVLADLAASDAYAANVVVMERTPLTYRGVSLVTNTLDAMEVALSAPTPWTYWLNLSGSDYPLLPMTTQRRLLAEPLVARKPRTFFTVATGADAERIVADRLGTLFVDPALADLGDARRPAVNATAAAAGGWGASAVATAAAARALTPVTDAALAHVAAPLFPAVAPSIHKAEAWMTLHRGFVAYAARGATARRSLLAFAYAADAAEHYFVSLAAGSASWRHSVLSNCLRDVQWRAGEQHPLTVDVEAPPGGGGTPPPPPPPPPGTVGPAAAPSTPSSRRCGRRPSGTRASLASQTRRSWTASTWRGGRRVRRRRRASTWRGSCALRMGIGRCGRGSVMGGGTACDWGGGKKGGGGEVGGGGGGARGRGWG